MDQEDAVTRLDSALRNTGIYTADVSNRMQTLAGDLQKVTTYGDETTLAAMGIFQSFAKLNEDGISKTIPLVQDLAARLGMDLNNAAMLVGKAIGSGTNALGRYGLEMETGSSKTERLTQVMAWLKSGFEGTAEAMGTTYSGRLEIIKNLTGEYKETLGKFILEGGTPFLTWLGDVLKREAGMQAMANTVRFFGATFYTVFKLNVDIIQAFMNFVMGTTKSIEVLGSVAARIMSGGFFSKEGREGIKKDLQYLNDLWGEYGKAVGNAFKTDIGKIIESYNKAFTKIEPEIKTTGVAVTEFGDETEKSFEKAKKATEDYVKTWDEWQKARFGERSPAVEGGFGEIVNEEDIEKAQDYVAAFASVSGPLVEELTTAQIAMEYFKNYVQNDFQPSITDAWESIWTSSGDTFKKIKEAFKDMIVTFVRALAKQYAVMGIAAIFAGAWGKGAKLLAASAALYAASGVIAKLQQGGTVKKQVGGSMYGDRQPAMLERGERVIPKETASRNAAALNRIEAGEGGGAPVNIYLGGKLLYSTMQRAFKNGQIVVDARAIR